MSEHLVRSFLESRYGCHAQGKAIIGFIWERYDRFISLGLADRQFATSFVNEDTYTDRLTEILLADHFLRLGLSISSKNEGPDFRIKTDGPTIWVEAITPSPTGIDPEHLAFPGEGGVVRKYPHEQIKLRWTSAFKEKYEKLSGRNHTTKGRIPGYLENGLVGKSEPYVIAINGARLGLVSWLEGISRLPYAAEIAFGIGPYRIGIDTHTLEKISEGHQHLTVVPNRNGAPVPSDCFLNPAYAAVSAIIATRMDDRVALDGRYPFVVVHNPLARNPVPIGFFGGDGDFVAELREDEYIVKQIEV